MLWIEWVEGCLQTRLPRGQKLISRNRGAYEIENNRNALMSILNKIIVWKYWLKVINNFIINLLDIYY